MRVLVVSGIWPPDVGGPASHAPEVARFLAGRGHAVEVVTTASGPPAPEPFPVLWAPRALPVGVRHVRGGLLVAARARRADVVYTTGVFGRSSLGSALARRRYVLKLTADPAFERARRRGMFAGGLAEFQEARSRSYALLRAARDAELRGAAHVVCPSAFLRDLVVGWGVAPEHVSVLPNPAPPLPPLPEPAEARARLRVEGPLLAFAGRLTAQKDLGVALAALAELPQATLLLAGEGPEREALERRAAELGLDGRVRFLGPQPRERVLELFRAADASVLSSSWENFPHTVVEALAVGTPVVATSVGGVAEVVRDGENGLLVAPGDPRALAEALRRLLGDGDLRRRLAEAAAPSVAAHAPERVYGRLEGLLAGAARADGDAGRGV